MATNLQKPYSSLPKIFEVEDLPEKAITADSSTNSTNNDSSRKEESMDTPKKISSTLSNISTVEWPAKSYERTWPTTPYSITPSGIYKNLYNEGDRTVSELIMTREMFVEAFVKYILEEQDPEMDQMLKNKLKEILFKE